MVKKKKTNERRGVRENEYLKLKDFIVDSKTPLSQLENEEESKLFYEAIKQLGEPCRTILLAYYGENMSIKEIATQLKIGNPEAIKVRKFRCLEKLKNLLSNHE